MLLNPTEVEVVREDLIEQIKSAFKDVTRDNAVSWSEARVLDSYGSDEDRIAARAQDTDTNWMEVALDPNWIPDPGVGGFVFLDIWGFRYYMAAALINYLVLGREADLEFVLSLNRDYFEDEEKKAVINFLRFRVQEDGRQYLVYRLGEENISYEDYVKSGNYWPSHMRSSWQDVLDKYVEN